LLSERAQLQQQAQDLGAEAASAMQELQDAQARMRRLNAKIAMRAQHEIDSGDKAAGARRMAKVHELSAMENTIEGHLAKLQEMRGLAQEQANTKPAVSLSFLQRSSVADAPEDKLAKEMTQDLEMNFNKIAPFGKEDTAKELQDHAAKTQDTLVDAVENAEVAEIKRAVFRALTRLRAATIKEFDTIARLETQAIDAYNDAHHYRAENPLAHLHEDEAPVETDKLKSFH